MIPKWGRQIHTNTTFYAILSLMNENNNTDKAWGELKSILTERIENAQSSGVSGKSVSKI